MLTAWKSMSFLATMGQGTMIDWAHIAELAGEALGVA